MRGHGRRMVYLTTFAHLLLITLQTTLAAGQVEDARTRLMAFRCRLARRGVGAGPVWPDHCILPQSAMERFAFVSPSTPSSFSSSSSSSSQTEGKPPASDNDYGSSYHTQARICTRKKVSTACCNSNGTICLRLTFTFFFTK